MHGQPQAEHQWLQKLVGSWTFEMEANMGPDKPLMKSSGMEVVRTLGGFWTIGEGECPMPDGGIGHTVMSLGYDSQRHCYIGTFMGSMMAQLWIYEGALDSTGKVLTLDTEGPSFSGSGTAKYQDIIEFVTDAHRILKSQMQLEDGTWMQFMTALYRRA